MMSPPGHGRAEAGEAKTAAASAAAAKAVDRVSISMEVGGGAEPVGRCAPVWSAGLRAACNDLLRTVDTCWTRRWREAAPLGDQPGGAPPGFSAGLGGPKAPGPIPP